MPKHDNNGEPLSIRRSILIWLAGGVFGWVVAVVIIYGTIRITSHDNIAQDKTQPSNNSIATEEKKLQEVAPAAGPSTGATAPQATPDTQAPPDKQPQ